MKERFVYLIVAGLALVASPRADTSGPPLHDAVADVDVLVDGAPQRRFAHGGRWYVEALKGREYAIRLRNPYAVRVAVALSVDGLNTIDARQTTAAGARKWVLEPYQTVTISGWQTSRTEARRFEFTTEENSYGQALGKTQNLGVISAAYFRERPRTAIVAAEPPAAEVGRAAPKRAAPAAERAQNDEYAATGMGRRTHHAVEEVDIELERELGLSHDQGHAEAGVKTYKDLTREQASEVIDRWVARRDSTAGEEERPRAGGPPRPPGEKGEERPEGEDTNDGGQPSASPVTDEQKRHMARLARELGYDAKEKRRQMAAVLEGEKVAAIKDLTQDQAGRIIEAWQALMVASAEVVEGELVEEQATAAPSRQNGSAQVSEGEPPPEPQQGEMGMFPHTPKTCPGHVWGTEKPDGGRTPRGFELCARCGEGRKVP